MLQGFESRQREDLNGDGDTEDHVVHVHNVSTGETTNLRLAGWPLTFTLSGDALVLVVSESEQGEDLNGDGDTRGRILHLVDLIRLSSKPVFVRGEANADGDLNLSDGLFILSWLFRGTEEPPCLDAADTDDSGVIDVSDAVSVFGVLFLGQGPPPAPGLSCGVDETDDRLDCRLFEPCLTGG